MMNAKLVSSLSPRSVQLLRAVLRRALGYALKWGLVTRNVATLVDSPRVVHAEMLSFTPKQATQFLAAIKGDRLEARHPTGTVYVAWDNAGTHADDEVEDVVRAAAGRLVPLYLPTYSPWLNPIAMLWRHFRREVTHCELFTTMADLLTAANDFFLRHNREPRKTLSVIGSKAAIVA